MEWAEDAEASEQGMALHVAEPRHRQ
eukprot:COSAG02_NODE_24223_length_694_cov_1.213445_2_plen_25_part_01